MAEVDWAAVAYKFTSLDNDRKVQNLQILADYLASISLSTLDDPEPYLGMIKSAIKSSNSQIYVAGLACVPHYFPLLIPLKNRTKTALSVNGANSPSPSISSSSSSFPMTKSTSTSGSHSAATLKYSINVLLALVLEKIGDPKEKVRERANLSVVAIARAALCFGIGPTSQKLQRSQGSTPSLSSSKALPVADEKHETPYQAFDRIFLASGLHSKVPRARAMCLQALLEIRQEYSKPPLPLRLLTPTLVALLEDQDSGVREAAKSTVMKIFGSKDVSDAARVDLKKELTLKGVRKNTLDSILDHLLNATKNGANSPSITTAPLPLDPPHSPRIPQQQILEEKNGVAPVTHGRINRSKHATVPAIDVPPPSANPADAFAPVSNSDPVPVFIASTRDLENELTKMLPAWEGKETEHNWMQRDSNIAGLRGMLKGGVYEKFPDAFILVIRQAEPGILKTLFSLRTTLCMAACRLITEMSDLMQQAFDPFVDTFLFNLLGMAGQTKKIAAQATQVSVDAILKNTSYHTKLFQQLWNFMGEKNVQVRQYVIAHVKVMIEVHGLRHRATIESGGGLDLLQKLLKKGITDANPGVRETARSSFWLCHEIFPSMTTQLLSTLDSSSQKQLEKVNPQKSTSFGNTLSNVIPPPKRPSVRDMINKTKAAAPTRTLSSSFKSAASVPLPPSPSATCQPPPFTPPQSPQRRSVSRLTTAPPTGLSPGKKRITTVSPDGKSLKSERQLVTSTPLRKSPEAKTSAATPSSIFHSGPHLISSPKATYNVPPNQREPSVAGESSRLDESVGSLNSLSFAGSAELPRNLMDLSIVEPIVADALQAQAEQAEQAAERLLELVDPDEDIAPGGALPNFHMKRHGGSRGGSAPPEYDVQFEDSLLDEKPIASRNDWWESAIPRDVDIETTFPSQILQTSDIDILLEDLKTPRPQLATLSTLGRICQDFPYPEAENPTVSEMERTKVWDEGRVFLRLFDNLSTLLRSTQDRDVKQSSLSVLKKLVLHQFPCFSGYEMELFSILLLVHFDDNKTILAGVESITDTVLDKIDPLYGLSALRSSLQNLLKLHSTSSEVPRSYSLALRGFSHIFSKLPAEVLEEEILRVQTLISQALNDTAHPDLRLSAVNCIVSAHKILQNDTKLFSLLPGLTKHQEQLLTYYFARATGT